MAQIKKERDCVESENIKDETAEHGLRIRDGRARAINFEMTGQTSFSVSFNFTTPDDVVSILKKYNAVYNKKRREWTTSIAMYKECAIEVSTFCKGRGIYVDLIP